MKIIKEYLNSPIAQIKKFGDNCHPDVRSELVRCHSQFRSAQPAIRELYIQQLRQWLVGRRGDLVKASLEELNVLIGRLRVMCMSADPTSVLLWSHYAEQHSGVAFEIDTEQLLRDNGIEKSMLEIKYCDELPPIYTRDSVERCMLFNEQLKLIDEEDKLHPYHAVKAKSWEYEAEWRAIAILESSNITGPKVTDIEIPVSAIRSVVLGVRFDQKHGESAKGSLTRALGALPGPIPVLHHAKTDSDSFKVDVPGFKGIELQRLTV